MASRTTAKEFFKISTTLSPGQKISKTFETKAAATSFRVCLYRVKNDLEAFDIAVSMKDNTVFLTKEGPALSYTQINEDGSVEEKVVNINPKAEEEVIAKKEAEFDEERKRTFNDPMSVEELVKWFNEEVAKIEAANDSDMIKRQELRTQRLLIFRQDERGINFPIGEHGRMTFASILPFSKESN